MGTGAWRMDGERTACMTFFFAIEASDSPRMEFALARGEDRQARVRIYRVSGASYMSSAGNEASCTSLAPDV